MDVVKFSPRVVYSCRSTNSHSIILLLRHFRPEITDNSTHRVHQYHKIDRDMVRDVDGAGAFRPRATFIARVRVRVVYGVGGSYEVVSTSTSPFSIS